MEESFFSAVFSILQNKKVCLKISLLSLQKVLCAEKAFSIYRLTLFTVFFFLSFSFEMLFLHETIRH